MCDESRPHGVGSTENLKRLGENSNPGITATLGTITQGQASYYAQAVNQGVTYTAKASGTAGNGIEINLIEYNMGQMTTIVTEDTVHSVVTIELAGDVVIGMSTATVGDVVNAVNNANLTLISASGSGSSIVHGVTWITSGGTTTGQTETVDLTVNSGASATGNITVTVAGVPYTVGVTAGDTPDQVAAAIAAKLTTDTVAGYTVTNPTGAIVRFTSSTPDTDVTDLVVTVD